MGLHLIMTTVYAATAVAVAPGCSWAHPGANPYRGDPAAALADFDLPAGTRRKLHALMAAHQTTDVATITRDAMIGHAGAEYADLREMHSGHGQVCHGAVDRSAWSARRRERALVYCADGACVVVPTICNNVSMVTRKPEDTVASGPPPDDTPIDITPAAGPPGQSSPESGPPDSFAGAGPGTIADSAPPGDVTTGGIPPGDLPPGGGGGGAGDSPPLIGPPGSGGGSDSGSGGGGGGGCCIVSPPTPPTSAVPEPSGPMLWLCGLVATFVAQRRARHVV